MKHLINQLIIGLSVLGLLASCYQVELPSHGEPKDGKEVDVQLVGISKDTITVVKEFTYLLHAAVYPDHAAAKNVLWESLNTDIATVNDTGLVSALEFGQTKVVVTTEDGRLTDTCVVKVLPNVHVETVTINPAETELIMGKKIKLEAVVLPEDSRVKDVTWTTSDPEIATVDEKGNVEGIKEGTVTITATSVDGGKIGTCAVTVKRIAVTGVKLNSTDVTMNPEGIFMLKATIEPADAHYQGVTWTTSDPAVVEVSETGMLTAKGLGNATVTVTTEDGGHTAQCAVTVKEPSAGTTILRLTFNLTACPASIADNQSAVPNGMYDFIADDGNAYTWEFFSNGTLPSYSSSGYLVLNKNGYMGTPVIPGGTLKTLTFTQAASTKASRRSAMATEKHTGELDVAYYDAAEEALGAYRSTGTKNTDYTYTIVNPQQEKSYYLVCANSGIGISKIVLEYEVKIQPLELTFNISNTTEQPAFEPVKDNIQTAEFDLIANDGNKYTWEVYRGGSGATTCNGAYFVLGKYSFLGTPEIPGKTLKTLKFIQKASTATSRRTAMTTTAHAGPTSAADYDAAVEAMGADRVTGTKDEEYTYTLAAPQPGVRYYLLCTNKGVGISHITLVYE